MLLSRKLPTGQPIGQHASISFTQWSENGQHGTLIKFGTGEQIYAPACQISCSSVQICGNTAFKTVKIGIFPTNLPLRGDSFKQFLCKSKHLNAATGSLCVFNLVTFWGQTMKL